MFKPCTALTLFVNALIAAPASSNLFEVTGEANKIKFLPFAKFGRSSLIFKGIAEIILTSPFSPKKKRVSKWWFIVLPPPNLACLFHCGIICV